MVMMRAPQNLVDGYGANSARSSHRKVARLKTQHLYGSAGTALLFRTPSRAPDSFISMPPYVQNEGMPERSPMNGLDSKGSQPATDNTIDAGGYYWTPRRMHSQEYFLAG